MDEFTLIIKKIYQMLQVVAVTKERNN